MHSFFDIAAATYDDTFTNTKIGLEQRKKVYQSLDFILNQDKKLNILELNCGTGEDAIAFAKKGHKIIATDISEGMIAVSQSKNSYENLHFEVLDSKAIYQDRFKNNFDVIFSNFGGLNCLCFEDLKSVINDSFSVLKPKGKFIMVLMPKNCLWEQIYFYAKGDFKKAKRRSTTDSLLVNVEGEDVPTWYYNPSDIETMLPKDLKITNILPVGFAVPPSYLENSILTKSILWPVLKSIEKRIKRPYFAKYSDHFLIELTKE
ncbi:ubiquinone/menaquinone biosynthesis C-methylase UbiE [Tenacibaculum skagerrakense]|uniref:Ubiquinone/menaquinone biosynthesis C-methylase UbiE n=1 Tax=Tenacibaculum skagerrakense TaxID=186571 RepID=A0A4R2P0X9_9FLAO|nr:class I SAM-dependent methyltransferase [Tenacibaculum skagerrakense]TCP28280.1 ubiquinone/menaquinone biosynthesis C-methylase UbiE [Tenacibaculum skagerrakense]